MCAPATRCRTTPPLSVTVTPPPAPVYGVAVHATAPAQEDKLASSLRRFATEDPSLVIRQDATTRQTVLSGAGEAHIRVVRARLERMGIEFEVENMRVAYLETLARPADVEARHKKQSGGHGQFAVAMVRFEPLPRGSGYEFDTEVTGGAIPRNLIPAVGAGIEDAMANGGRHGFPMVDLRAVCYDGKHHSVDSSEMAFKIAGSLALKQAVEQAGSAVLEPISEISVEVSRRLPGRRARRPELPPGPGVRHRAGLAGGHQRDPRPCAHLGDPQLRDRSALDDRRHRHLQRRASRLPAAAPRPAGQGQGRRRTDPAAAQLWADGPSALEGTRTPNLLIRSQMLYPN